MEKYTKSKLIALAMLFFMTGIVGTRPLIPLLSNDLGADAFQIGIIIALFSFVSLFLAVKVGHWIDKFGTILPLILSATIGGISLALPLLLGNLTGVYLSQIFGGVSQTMFALAAQSFVGRQSSNIGREKHVAIFSLGVAGGGFIGPLVGGMMSDWLGYAEAIFIFGGFSFLACLIVFILYSEERKEEWKNGYDANTPQRNSTEQNNKKENVLGLLKIVNLRKGIMISMTVLLARDIYLSYFPLLANEFGYSATVIGIIIGLHNGAGLLIRLFLTNMIEKWGKSEVVVVSILFSGLFYALIPSAGNLIFSIIIATILGFLLGIGQPLSLSTTVHFSPKNRVGEILGLRLTFNRLTQFTSPIVFGGVASLINLSSIFWIVAVVLVLGSTKTFIKEESKKYMNEV